MDLLFVGTASAVPEPERETACLLVNGRHLVDAGWCAALKMLEYGVKPTALESVLFTHFHHDHCLGLPHILFYNAMRGPRTQPLRIAGPADHLENVLQAAQAMLQMDRFPELRLPLDLRPMQAGDSLDLDGVKLETISARHTSGVGVPEPAHSMRFTEAASGTVVVYSGDTSANPDLVEFSRGADLLIHDAAHTRPAEAAEIARSAGVGWLLLIHYKLDRASAILAEARDVFPASELAREGGRV